MKVFEALAWAQRQLEAANSSTARLDALVLLEDTTGTNRAKLLAEPNLKIAKKQLLNYKKYVLTRCIPVPLAYVRKKTEFYGRDFFIDERVLEPRPESETLIDETIQLVKKEADIDNIIDVGTGSGALIITLKLELPHIKALATDISKDCLEVTKLNLKKYSVNIKLYKANLLTPINVEDFTNKTIVVANLPYVPDSWHINLPAMSEPTLAIFGGHDGLELYRQLFDQIANLTIKPAYVVTESMPPQHGQLKRIASNVHYCQLKSSDFIQVFSLSA